MFWCFEWPIRANVHKFWPINYVFHDILKWTQIFQLLKVLICFSPALCNKDTFKWQPEQTSVSALDLNVNNTYFGVAVFQQTMNVVLEHLLQIEIHAWQLVFNTLVPDRENRHSEIYFVLHYMATEIIHGQAHFKSGRPVLIQRF